jgi:hypothetical protein
MREGLLAWKSRAMFATSLYFEFLVWALVMVSEIGKLDA